MVFRALCLLSSTGDISNSFLFKYHTISITPPMGSLQDGIDTLRSAVIDGRTENVRHRQNELLKLDSGLRKNSSSTCDAISKDSGGSASDAQKEFVLAMDAVQKMYETLDFEKSLEDEYLVKEGKDNLSRRVRIGIVAIRPTNHTRLYSIVSPLAAAIAAGNCVLLEVRKTFSSFECIVPVLI